MINEIQKLIDKLSSGTSLSVDESGRLFQIIMNNGATPAQIAASLLALKTKGETADEITGAVKALRTKMVRLKLPEQLRKNAIDVCGTGGDNKGTYNISSAVSFVVAGCGIPVAKHGNRAISSRSGSADVLSELGVHIDLTPEQAAECLEKAGITFMLAPNYHKSMKIVAPVRTELATRTIFNVLGPLLNPAMVEKQIVGVYSKELVPVVCNALKNLGHTAAMVVHGADGMDEISVSDKTYIAELSNNKIHEYEIKPEDLGIEKVNPEKLIGGDPVHNARAMRQVLAGNQNEYYVAILANSAAALKVSGLALNFHEGMSMASESIKHQKASEALAKLIEVSNSFGTH